MDPNNENDQELDKVFGGLEAEYEKRIQVLHHISKKIKNIKNIKNKN